jgi:hypothetical protein
VRRERDSIDRALLKSRASTRLEKQARSAAKTLVDSATSVVSSDFTFKDSHYAFIGLATES